MWRIKTIEEKFPDPKNEMATQVQEGGLQNKKQKKKWKQKQNLHQTRPEEKNTHYVLELKIKNRINKEYWKL